VTAYWAFAYLSSLEIAESLRSLRAVCSSRSVDGSPAKRSAGVMTAESVAVRWNLVSVISVGVNAVKR